jgi:glutamine amidotransferase
MSNLHRYGLVDSIYREIEKGKPFLGICLGFQLLFAESEEFGRHAGLNLLRGRVVRFPETIGADGGVDERQRNPLKVPHMGWNRVTIEKPSPLFRGLPQDLFFYFVHSYYVLPEEADLVSSFTEYGITFASSIWKDHLFACQFHPEKSQEMGLRVLKNFGSFS